MPAPIVKMTPGQMAELLHSVLEENIELTGRLRVLEARVRELDPPPAPRTPVRKLVMTVLLSPEQEAQEIELDHLRDILMDTVRNHTVAPLIKTTFHDAILEEELP